MTKIVVTQVTFLDGTCLISGEPIDDRTKLIVARAADPGWGILMAMAVVTGEQVTTEPDEDSIVEIIEKPG